MARGQRAQARRPAHCICAPAARSANSRSSIRSSSSRIVVGGAQRRFEMAARLVERGQRGVERLHGRLDQRRRLRGAALQPPHAPWPAAAPAIAARRRASCASRRSSATFSACIMAARRSASAVSSPACGARRVSSSTAWRSHRPRARRALDLGAMRRDGGFARARARPTAAPPRRRRSRGRRRHRAARDASPHRRRRARRAGRGFPPAPRRARASTCTLTG